MPGGGAEELPRRCMGCSGQDGVEQCRAVTRADLREDVRLSGGGRESVKHVGAVGVIERSAEQQTDWVVSKGAIGIELGSGHLQPPKQGV